MRVAFAYLVDDRTWLGGKNYLASLFSAVRCAGADDIELVFVTGERTDTSLPVDFPFLEVVRTPMIDRFTPAWWWRQLQRGPSRLRADPALERLLGGLSVDVLSHSGALGSRSAIRTLGWLPDFQFLHLQQYWTPAQLRATTRTYLAATRHCDALVLSSQAALDDLRAFDSRCRAQPHVLRFVAA
ncbi:MAG: hypothetical protein ABI574_15130, partial [Burkholderiales bacterium]